MLTIPRRGLILDLPLNWDAKDYSWNWYDGTPTDVAWVETNIGYQNKCASFNGSSSYVDCWTILNWISNFCISFWYNSKNASQWKYMISQAWSNSWDKIFAVYENWSSSFVDFFNNNWNSIWTITFKSEANKWINLIIIVNWNNAYLYKNWILIWNSFWLNDRDVDSTTPFYIGRRISDYWIGKICLFRIYNRVLTEPEIHTLYLEWLRKLTPARNTYL